MPKRTPYSPTKKKASVEQQKRLAAIKTAIPLVLTLLLLGVLYFLVLLPEEPANILKRSVLNSSDTSKQKSYRYDGTFGDTNRGLSGEYAGQKASNGDQEFRVRLKVPRGVDDRKGDDDTSTSLELVRVSDTLHVRIGGVENLKQIAEGITGAKVPDDSMMSFLRDVQDTWITIDPAVQSTLTSIIPCVDLLPALSNVVHQPLTDSSYPFEYVSGPKSSMDDSADQLYEARISTRTREQGTHEQQMIAVANCFESEYAVDDFRLREAGTGDIDAVRVTVRVDPISYTVKQIIFKQVGPYFSLNIRDYNKDVDVIIPSDTVSLTALSGRLTESSRAYLLTRLGVPAL